jgi:hypothetical protein
MQSFDMQQLPGITVSRPRGQLRMRMPFCKAPKQLQVFHSDRQGTRAERESGEAVVKHLAAHGIKADSKAIPRVV